MEKSKIKKVFIWTALSLVIIGAAIGGYVILKPKKETGNVGNANESTGEEEPAKGNFLTNVANLGLDIFGQIKDTKTLADGDLIATVAYIAPANNNGKITDQNIMEIRFDNDNANVKIGDTIKLTGTLYDGTYPVVGLWGTAGKAKTAKVRKTTAMSVSGIQTPGAKAYKVSSSNFSGNSIY